MTKQTRQFIWAMRILAVIYLLVGLLFFFKPEETFYLLNIGPKVFKAYEEIPLPSEHFWVVLSTSMMMMLVILALYSSWYPRVFGFVFVHCVSKAVSTGGFLFFFLNQKPFFAYILGACVDGLILLLIMGFYIRSMASKPVLEHPATEPTIPANDSTNEPVTDHESNSSGEAGDAG